MTGSPPIPAHLLQAEQHEERNGGEAALDPLLQRHLDTQRAHVSRATCHVARGTWHNSPSRRCRSQSRTSCPTGSVTFGLNLVEKIFGQL